MKIVLILAAAASFVAGQFFLFRGIKRLDKFVNHKPSGKTNFKYDDSCRYPDEDVVE